MTAADAGPGFRLADVAGLVCGYGLASLVVREFVPGAAVVGAGPGLVTLLVFAWLGMAMSGPVLFLVRRPGGVGRTWAETSWLLIGAYWTVMTLVTVPGRLGGTQFLETAGFGLIPVLFALGFRFFGPGRDAGSARENGPPERPVWTHSAGLVLIWTWPVAWVGLILLGHTFG